MIDLTDPIIAWVVATAGDTGIRLIFTSRDQRRLRQILDKELEFVVSQVNPEARAAAERALVAAVSVPAKLHPDPGVPLSLALHQLIAAQLRVLEHWMDEDGELNFAMVTGIEPDVLADRVADAVVSGLRHYVAATGLAELVHGLDAAEVTGKLDALSLQIAGLRVNTWAAATFTLPHSISSFTGRREDLNRLLEFGSKVEGTRGRALGIYAIDGMAGIGKTALAVHAAHLLAPRYPDGQIFLHLHGHTPGQRPVEPADALATLLLTAGVPPEQIPDNLAARTASWRDWVDAKKLLLLLDDAISSEQVRPLMPGSPQALVMITSRRRLTALDEVMSMSLDTLPPDEATELFTRLAARPGLTPSDPGVAEAVRLCGYLPLAIRLTAAQLAHHASWTLNELVADLASTRDRIAAMRAESESVTSAFDLSYQDLTPDQQLLFRRLGLHPGSDFDAYIAAALSGFDLRTAQRLLDDLYDHHLIDEPSRGRYRMHDLLREQARTLAAQDSAADNEAATDALLSYFLHTAIEAAGHIAGRMPAQTPPPVEHPPAWSPSFSGATESLAWLRAERTNLHSAVESAVSRTIPQVAIYLPVVLTPFLRGQGFWEQAIALNRSAEAVARTVNDRSGEALALWSRSSIHRVSGEYPAAITCLEQAMGLHRGLGDRLGVASDLYELGVLRRLTCDYAGDEETQTEARRLYRELGNSLGEANTFHEMGIAKWLMGNLSGALESQLRARDLYQESDNSNGLAAAYDEIALVNNSAGNYPVAVTNAASSLNIHREIGNRYSEAYSLMFLGTSQYLTGDNTAAVETLLRVVDLDKEMGNRYAMAFALRELGIVRLRLGEYEQARTILVQAVAIHHEFGNRYGEGYALASLGRAQIGLGNLDPAGQNLGEALRIHQEFGHRLGETDTLLGTGQLFMRRQSHSDARRCYNEALRIARQIGAQLEQGQALAGLATCSAVEGNRAAATESWNEALAIFRKIGAPEIAAVEAELHGLG
jgi:tetratricopeptide (TPR) repeat protein